MKKHERQSKRPRSSSRFPNEVRVIYEDEAIVALDKPPGLAAVPVAKGAKVPSAWSLLSAELRQQRHRAFVVHRIDRFSSGILLFAKTERDRDAMVQQFLEHTPVRQYLAVVRGHLSRTEATLIHYFRKQGSIQKISRENDRRAARAELRYVVEKELRDASLLRISLVTGLQNQIRAQFSAIGHPVIGDRKYHPEEAGEQRIARVALHAACLEFTHPRTGKLVHIESELPYDLRSLLKALMPRLS